MLYKSTFDIDIDIDIDIACIVRTCFILIIFSGIGLGGSQDPQDPPLATPMVYG